LKKAVGEAEGVEPKVEQNPTAEMERMMKIQEDLDLIFSVQQERVVNQDNTIQVDNRVFQIEKTRWRDTLAGATVVVHEHLDGRVSIRYGPHAIAEYRADQLPVKAPRRRGTPRPPMRRAA
jgi:hypothetical protein